MGLNDGGVFVTQKAYKRRPGHAQDAVDADQLEEMVAGVAQTSQSTLLLKKKKEMREVSPSTESSSEKGYRVGTGCSCYLFEWFVRTSKQLSTRRCW